MLEPFATLHHPPTHLLSAIPVRADTVRATALTVGRDELFTAFRAGQRLAGPRTLLIGLASAELRPVLVGAPTPELRPILSSLRPLPGVVLSTASAV